MQLYITNNPDARNLSAKDSNIGVSDIWTEKAIGNTLNEEATSFAIKGEVREKASVKIDVYLKTSDNNDGDSYVNIVSAQTSKIQIQYKLLLLAQMSLQERFLVWFGMIQMKTE